MPKPKLFGLFAAVLTLTAMGVAPARAADPSPTYYLALGDSLASGGGGPVHTTPTGHRLLAMKYERELEHWTNVPPQP
jgi:hypothetical protein